MAVARPNVPEISFAEAGCALSWLIPVAGSGTYQSTRVADFLLAWWNGADNGKFGNLHLCKVAAPIAEGMLIIMSFLAESRRWKLWRDPRLERGSEE